MPDGYALGGGFELALNCDFRVLTKNCTVGLPETSLAIIPGASGTQMLPRLVPASTAKKLIFFGQRLSTNQARELGLVDFEVDDYENGLNQLLDITSELNSKVSSLELPIWDVIISRADSP